MRPTPEHRFTRVGECCQHLRHRCAMQHFDIPIPKTPSYCKAISLIAPIPDDCSPQGSPGLLPTPEHVSKQSEPHAECATLNIGATSQQPQPRDHSSSEVSQAQHIAARASRIFEHADHTEDHAHQNDIDQSVQQSQSELLVQSDCPSLDLGQRTLETATESTGRRQLKCSTTGVVRSKHSP